MSKYEYEKKNEVQAATLVRLSSLVELKKNFEKFNLVEHEKYFDRRVYYDPNTKEEYYPWMFSKTLEHAVDTGFPKKKDVEKLVTAWKVGSIDALDAIPQFYNDTNPNEKIRKLEGVAGSQSFNMIGTDSSVVVPNKFYAIDSEANAFEMAEVYAMSLVRDIPFKLFDDNLDEASLQQNEKDLLDLLKTKVTQLNNFTEKTSAPTKNGNITVGTLFRGPSLGETVGPYVSQFLLHPFKYGNISIEQKFTSEYDHGASTTIENFLNGQNGRTPDNISSSASAYCYSPRILGSKVHSDPLFQFYYDAALICMQTKLAVPSGFSHDKTSDWTSGGGPNVLASIAHVCQGALRMAWHSKYGIGMKIRPEVMAHRIHLGMTNAEMRMAVPGLDNITTIMQNKAESLLTEVKSNNILTDMEGLTIEGSDTYLLKNQYPEGSPAHPSWPAGHATVAGASVTVLKAMLNCHDENNLAKPWTEAVYVSNTGDGLDEVPVVTGMTVISELNKLASNVTLGRDWAGVHYRCDGDCGVIAGEDFAITYLQDVAKEYHESKSGLFKGFLLEKFNGDKVNITANGVYAL